MADELEQFLASLERDQRYRVNRVLKVGECETTELVSADDGPFAGTPLIRKRFDAESGLGSAYVRIWEAQQRGERFSFVPRIVDCHSTGRELVVVSEYAAGETLAEVVYRLDPSLELAADVFPRLCDAVSELHERFHPPLIHRDLKPSNIILSYGGLKLIDFGIARTFSDGAEADTHRFGTRAYAPPEQFGYGQTDVRSDVYALGMLLYYCLTERTPDAQARDVGWRDKRIPEPMRAVIGKAAAFDPDDRFGSAAELKAAFLEALDAIRYSSTKGLSPRSLARSISNFIANVPRPVGLVWDAAIVFVLAILLAVSIDSAFNPPADSPDANVPAGQLLISYGLMFLLMFVPSGFLVCDRRPLYRIFKRLRDVPLAKQVGACVFVIALGVVAVGISTMFFPR